MSLQSWETLPVAVSDLERRKHNEEDIAYEINANIHATEHSSTRIIEELDESLALSVEMIDQVSRKLLQGLGENTMETFSLEEPPLGARIEQGELSEEIVHDHRHTTLPGMSRAALSGMVVIEA